MASRLNPHASVFIPTSHFPTPPAFSSGYIPPAGPPPFTPFSYGCLLPPHPHPLPFLPPPPPPRPPAPPPPFISVQRPCILPPPPTVATEGEVNPIWVNRPSNVRITTRGTGARAGGGRGRGFGGGRGGRYQQTDFGVRERERGRGRGRGRGRSRSSHQFTEEEEEENNINGGRNWRNLKKHGIRYLREDENNTTVMIKNIPSDFTRQMLIEHMDRHCMSENQRNGDRRCISAYDFLYLPIDFKTRKNKGYAFVNFTHPSAAWKFFNAFNCRRWESTVSPKIRMIICARIQGKRALVQHFEKSKFDCETDEYLPVCFKPARDGSGNYVEVSAVGRYRGY